MAAFDLLDVKPTATPNGFRWNVVGLRFPQSKTDSDGRRILMGRPTHHTVAGPFSTRDAAKAALKAAFDLIAARKGGK